MWDDYPTDEQIRDYVRDECGVLIPECVSALLERGDGDDFVDALLRANTPAVIAFCARLSVMVHARAIQAIEERDASARDFAAEQAERYEDERTFEQWGSHV